VSANGQMIRVLLADPGWKPRDQLPGPTRGATSQYRTQPTHEIMRMSLPPIADDALLILWRLSSMQRDALDVVRAWGFEEKAEIVWNKLTKTGKPWFGMGRYTRGSHETAIIAARGKFKVKVRNMRSTFDAPVPTYWEGHPDVGLQRYDRKGQPRFYKNGRRKGQPVLIEVGEYIHSAKPDRIFEIACELGGSAHPSSHAELFARVRRPGWFQLGDQLK